jgi:predicted DNA-binding transcriptional regulator AlpA
MIRTSSNDIAVQHQRLGYRYSEFMKLTGISRPSLFRLIQNGDLKVVKLGTIKLVPHTEIVRLGLIAA